jgi:DNA-binding CsgD family transcriptional regulator
MKRQLVVAAIFLVQLVCALVFVSDVLSSVVGFETNPMPWELRELMEIGAAVGLILGVVFGALTMWWLIQANKLAQARLSRASGAFGDLLLEKFIEWGLTPAERDVALFAIKGMSTAEIAALRTTSEGTVKAQTNAIYRKAGVSGRSQLLSVFIEDLMRDETMLRTHAEGAGAEAGGGQSAA